MRSKGSWVTKFWLQLTSCKIQCITVCFCTSSQGSPCCRIHDIVSDVSSTEGNDAIIHCLSFLLVSGVPDLAEFSLHGSWTDGCHPDVCAHQVMPCSGGEGIHKVLGAGVDAATCHETTHFGLLLEADFDLLLVCHTCHDNIVKPLTSGLQTNVHELANHDWGERVMPTQPIREQWMDPIF